MRRKLFTIYRLWLNNMRRYSHHLEVRIELILAMLVFALATVVMLNGYLIFTEKSSYQSQDVLMQDNSELLTRVADYAKLQQAIKEEYLRCRNVISKETMNIDSANYCRDYVKWTTTLPEALFQ